MQAFAQNAAIGATLLFLAMMVLRQVPVLGFFVRLAMRLVLLASPVMVLVLLIALVWFHGGSLVGGARDGAAAPPPTAPLPAERPGD